jgi:ribosomal protein S18 acetylase RimI-like enzyme
MITFQKTLLGKLPKGIIKKLGKLTFGDNGLMYNHIEIALDKEPEDSIDTDEVVVAAYDENKIVGWVLCMGISNAKEAVIGTFVRPSYRRMGIGTKLIQHIKQYLKKNNSVKTLIVNFHDDRSKNFYKKQGSTSYDKELDADTSQIKLAELFTGKHRND